jgi:glutaredoxin
MIVVYGRPGCNYCEQSKSALDSCKIDYKYIDIWQDDNAKQYIIKRGLKTVPQIYDSNESHIGGYNELLIYLSDKGYNVYDRT